MSRQLSTGFPVFFWLLMSTFVTAPQVFGQKFEANEDEAKVPEYVLPAILEQMNGDKAAVTRAWEKRRVELLKLFTDQMFGSYPSKAAELSWTVIEERKAFGELARRRQIRVSLKTSAAKMNIDLLLYSPATSSARVPVFLGLNFRGNHTTTSDPKVALPLSWVPNDKDTEVTDNRASDKGRGSNQGRWPFEMLIQSGFAVATAYYGDIDPDFDDGFENGVHALFPEHRPDAAHPDRWGTIAGWSWGLSRLLDVLERLPDVDARKTVVVGHSRLGKTAIWAGATDSRFAAVISNNSGCGGAALSKRIFGETVGRINTSFPHWFCDNFQKYNLRESDLTFDQHQLLALIAPRPLYVASATNDLWADPRGEFLATFHASKLYAALGLPPLAIAEFPKPNEASVGTVSYHLRDGNHDINAWDWERYAKFAKQELR